MATKDEIEAVALKTVAMGITMQLEQKEPLVDAGELTELEQEAAKLRVIDLRDKLVAELAKVSPSADKVWGGGE